MKRAVRSQKTGSQVRKPGRLHAKQDLMVADGGNWNFSHSEPPGFTKAINYSGEHKLSMATCIRFITQGRRHRGEVWRG